MLYTKIFLRFINQVGNDLKFEIPIIQKMYLKTEWTL